MAKSIKLTSRDILFPQYRGRLVEGITYNPSNDTVMWVDIIAAEVHRVHHLDWTTHEILKFSSAPAESIGSIALTNNDNIIIVCCKHGLAKGDFTKKSIEYFYRFQFDSAYLRSNDGYIDPWGNLWLGIMNDFPYPVKNQGKLIRVGCHDLEVTTMVDNTIISNGTAFSSDSKSIFWTDSANHLIWKFDYDLHSNELTNKRVFADIAKLTNSNGEPDGMTITKDNEIYSAVWGQSKIVHLSDQGEIVEEFQLPAEQCSCVTIGGKDGNTLFITTAHKQLDDREAVIDPSDLQGDLGGFIYSITLDRSLNGRNKFIWGGKVN